MNNVIYGQYDSNKYPLKRFYITELPIEIKKVLYKQSQRNLAVFRGGFAFILLLNVKEYQLKDLDMLAFDSNKSDILEDLASAEAVYVNRNTHGDLVITAFWQDDSYKEYFKLDILLCREMPRVCNRIVDGQTLHVVSASYVWRNRIEKITEKEIRKHDDKKTLNHFKVAKELSYYLLGVKNEVFVEDIDVVKLKLLDLERILSKLITENELKEFLQLQMELVRS